MALERPGRSASEMMREGMGDEAMPEEELPAEEKTESSEVQIPKSIVGDQSVEPGDVVRLEVVSVDEETGMLNVKYAETKAQPEDEITSEKMAAKFD